MKKVYIKPNVETTPMHLESMIASSDLHNDLIKTEGNETLNAEDAMTQKQDYWASSWMDE